MKLLDKQFLTRCYQWLVIAIGAGITLFYATRLALDSIDLRFLLLASMTVLVSSRIAVKVPRFNTNVTISDTFIFLTILLYGGAAGILLASAEGLSSGVRISKKARTILFNSAVMGCSAWVTTQSLKLVLGPTTSLTHQRSSVVIIAICLMGHGPILHQYRTGRAGDGIEA